MNSFLAELKGRQGELYHLQTRTLPVKFRSGKLESIKSKELEGVALRVIDDGRVGFATTTNIKDTRGLVGAALATATFGEKVSLAFPAQEDHPSVDTYDPAIVELSETDLVELGQDLLARLEGVSSEVD
ncbi:MAG: DNA gyrase modulator, partial [Candidatus Bipolaricaulota bacterium]